MTPLYTYSADPAQNHHAAYELDLFANCLAEAAPSWGATSKGGHAHVIAAAAVSNLARVIHAAGGQPGHYGRGWASGAENALHEILCELVKERGAEEVAQLLYGLADGVATGQTPTHLSGAIVYLERVGLSGCDVKLLHRTGAVQRIARCDTRSMAHAVAQSFSHESEVRMRLGGG